MSYKISDTTGSIIRADTCEHGMAIIKVGDHLSKCQLCANGHTHTCSDSGIEFPTKPNEDYKTGYFKATIDIQRIIFETLDMIAYDDLKFKNLAIPNHCSEIILNRIAELMGKV